MIAHLMLCMLVDIVLILFLFYFLMIQNIDLFLSLLATKSWLEIMYLISAKNKVGYQVSPFSSVLSMESEFSPSQPWACYSWRSCCGYLLHTDEDQIKYVSRLTVISSSLEDSGQYICTSNTDVGMKYL